MTTRLVDAQTEPASSSGIQGVITISPAYPGPTRAGMPNSKPLSNTRFTVRSAAGALTTFTTDAEGRFHVARPAGHYTVSIANGQPRVGYFGPFEVDVTSGKMTTVAWQCDSGMR